MALSLIIGGTDYSGMVAVGSLVIVDGVGGPTTASFILRDRESTARVGVGMPVLIKQITYQPEPDPPIENDVFAGQVDAPSRVRIKGTRMHEWTVQCADYSCILTRRIWTGTISDGTKLNDAVGQMGSILAAEGFDLSNVAGDVTLPKMQFQALPISDILSEMARITGYKWWVGADKKLHFKAASTDSAPWVLDSMALVNSFELQNDRSQYRNLQQVLGTKLVAEHSTTAKWKADGRTTTFRLAAVDQSVGTAYNEIARATVLTVDGAAKVLGVPGTPDATWLYDVGGSHVRTTGLAPPANAVVELTYFGRFRVIGQWPSQEKVPTDPEIVARREVEGGTGIYEAVEVDESIDESLMAQAKARSLIRLHGHIPLVVTFSTFKPGLRAGQNLRIALPNYTLDKDFRIDSVQITDVETADQDHELRYAVTAVASEVASWESYFDELLRERERPQTQVWDEYKPLAFAPADVVRVSDSLTIDRLAFVHPHIAGTFAIGFAEVT